MLEGGNEGEADAFTPQGLLCLIGIGRDDAGIGDRFDPMRPRFAGARAVDVARRAFLQPSL